MKKLNSIDLFIDKLSTQDVSNNTTNMYFGNTIASQICRKNLKLYLNKMIDVKPSHLLLGEAPGYKGCGITGIAFTSERILNENTFYKNQGFRCLNKPSKLSSEISATIVWSVLDNYTNIPLIWNIFPFHPHDTSKKKSNRTPTETELELGKVYLNLLLKIFNIDNIIALGRKPESKLKGFGYHYGYIRHPANGGKNKFVNGLKEVLK